MWLFIDHATFHHEGHVLQGADSSHSPELVGAPRVELDPSQIRTTDFLTCKVHSDSNF